MKISDIEQALVAARKELEEATRALAGKQQGGETQRYDTALARCRTLQREQAKALGEEYAVPLEWPHPWDTGAPIPHVVSSGRRTLLVYIVDQPDPDWDGTYVNVISPSETAQLAIVEFKHCLISKFGGPNDEVLSGHPLYNKGLEPYAAHLVKNSTWIAEQQAINAIHSLSSAAAWPVYKHYMLLFHDEMFECIATDFVVGCVSDNFPNTLARCVERVSQ